VPPDRLRRAQDIFAELQTSKTKGGAKPKPLSAEEAADLFKRLKGAISALSPAVVGEDGGEQVLGPAGGVFECAVCLDDLQEEQVRILRACKHTFCASCLDHIISTRHGNKVTCPMCRTDFAEPDVLRASDLEMCIADKTESRINDRQKRKEGEEVEVEGEGSAGQAPKITALISALQEEWARDTTQKAVIFSQFTAMLDLTQDALKAAFGPQICARLDGSMPPDKRAAEVSRFSADAAGSPRVILVSLKAGGTGINLTRANLVFLLDLWWNFAVEEQAMDRVYRIGQQRDVKVVRYVCASSIEERILQVQESKTLLGQAALNQLSAEQLRNARLGHLTKLFERH